jgi:hypothetical protein
MGFLPPLMVTGILPVVSDHSPGLGGFQKASWKPVGLACHVWALRGAEHYGY